MLIEGQASPSGAPDGGLWDRLTEGDLSDWVRAAACAGLGILRGLPIGEVPPTPHAHGVDTGTSSITEMLIRLGKAFGTPCTFEGKVNPELVHDVYYVSTDHDTQLGSGASKLEWHVEDGCFENRADWLLLLCLRGAESVTTSLALIDDFNLQLGDVGQLMSERVRLELDDSFANARYEAADVPTLSVRRGRVEVIFDPAYAVSLSESMAGSLARLRAEADRVRTDVVLEAGDLLVLNNRRVVHGRSAYDVESTARERWIKRLLVMARSESIEWASPGVVRGQRFSDTN